MGRGGGIRECLYVNEMVQEGVKRKERDRGIINDAGERELKRGL